MVTVQYASTPRARSSTDATTVWLRVAIAPDPADEETQIVEHFARQAAEELAPAHNELADAEHYLRELQSAPDFPAAERAWKAMLGALEKTWEKLRASLIGAGFGRDHSWLRAIEALREGDELLLYLQRARNTDQHTIHRVVQHVPGRVGFGPVMGPFGGVAIIDKLVISGAGEVQEYRGSHPLRVTKYPERFDLLPAVADNRRKAVSTPTPRWHLGIPVGTDCRLAGQLGFMFYRCVSGAAVDRLAFILRAA